MTIKDSLEGNQFQSTDYRKCLECETSMIDPPRVSAAKSSESTLQTWSSKVFSFFWFPEPRLTLVTQCYHQKAYWELFMTHVFVLATGKPSFVMHIVGVDFDGHLLVFILPKMIDILSSYVVRFKVWIICAVHSPLETIKFIINIIEESYSHDCEIFVSDSAIQ